MLKKLDSFINRFFNWKFIVNYIIGCIIIIPYNIVISFYNIPVLYSVIMVLSIGTSISFFAKAIKYIVEKESL